MLMILLNSSLLILPPKITSVERYVASALLFIYKDANNRQ